MKILSIRYMKGTQCTVSKYLTSRCFNLSLQYRLLGEIFFERCIFMQKNFAN